VPTATAADSPRTGLEVGLLSPLQGVEGDALLSLCEETPVITALTVGLARLSILLPHLSLFWAVRRFEREIKKAQKFMNLLLTDRVRHKSGNAPRLTLGLRKQTA